MIRFEITSSNTDEALEELAELGHAAEAVLRNIAAWKAEKAAAEASNQAKTQETAVTAMAEHESAPAKAPKAKKPDEDLKPEVLRARGVDAAKTHGKSAVKAIVEKLGADSITNIPVEKRKAFMDALDALDEKGGDPDT